MSTGLITGIVVFVSVLLTIVHYIILGVMIAKLSSMDRHIRFLAEMAEHTEKQRQRMAGS